MLLTAFSLLLWIPASVGYGHLSDWVYRYFQGEARTQYSLDQLIVGLAVLGALGNALNFVLPISSTIQLVVLLVGLLLFVRRLRVMQKPDKLLVAFAVCWLIIISLMKSALTLGYFDLGLYGLQTIKWYNESRVPLGLANLHERFGYNSAWYAVSSMTQMPFFPKRYDFSVSDEIIDWTMGVAIFYAIRALQKKWTLQNLFGLFSGLASMTPVLGTFSISTFSTDFPVLWLTIYQAALLGSLVTANSRKINYLVWLSATLAFFGLTLKLSAGPLLLVPCIVLWIGKRQGVTLMRARLLYSSALSSVAICLPWLLRYFVTTGCIIYPVAFTCFPKLNWALSLPAVRFSADVIIKGWARQQDPLATVVISDWGWLRPWLALMWGSTEVVFLLGLLLSGLIILGAALISRNAIKNPYERFAIWVIQLPFWGGVIFWFLNAPAPRFGAGYFWALAILCLSSGGLYLLRDVKKEIFALAAFALKLIVVSFALAGFVRFSADIFNSAPNLLIPPGVPQAAIMTRPSNNGIIYYAPTRDYQCWDAPLTCTPSSSSQLNIYKSRDGEVRLFTCENKPGTEAWLLCGFR